MAKSKNNFCNPDNFFVQIPYKDFARMVEIANNYDKMVADMAFLRDQIGAVRGLYSELLTKVQEIDKYL